MGRVVTWDEAAAAFESAFTVTLGLRFQRAALSEGERRRADELVSEKYGNAGWMQRV